MLRLANYLSKTFFFNVDHFKSHYWVCYNIASFVYVLVFWPWGMWDLSSLTRERTHTPCIGRQSLNHRTTRDIPGKLSLKEGHPTHQGGLLRDPSDKSKLWVKRELTIISTTWKITRIKESESPSVSPTLCNPVDNTGKNTGVGRLSLLQGIFPTQGLEPRSPAVQVDSLPAEPPRKPKNTGVGSLSSAGDLPNPGIKPGSVALQAILYQLSYQGSPIGL